MPTFDTKIGDAEKLKQVVEKELEEKFSSITNEIIERIVYELKIILASHYESYFLIIYDIASWAKKNNIRMSPGRGKAASSLVLYVLGITDINPLDYDLIFDLFFNEALPQGNPDLVLDFDFERRDEVIDYIKEKYGNDRVAFLTSFNYLRAKNCMESAGLALGFTKKELAKILDLIPGHPSEIVRAQIAASDSKGVQEFANNPGYKKLLEVTNKLNGIVISYQQDSAGLLISHYPICDIAPTLICEDSSLLVQYTRYEYDHYKIMNFDFLGLKWLTKLSKLEQAIKNENTYFSVDAISLDDEKTLKLFQEGKTDDIFQFESDGMKNILKDFIPECFEDLVLLSAAYRPGLLQFIPELAKIKNGNEFMQGRYKNFSALFADTYGIPLYEEQIIKIIKTYNGLSFSESLSMFNEMKKKENYSEGIDIRPFLHNYRDFVFDYLMKHASKVFSKSHAVSYTKLAFQLAYFKAHHPELYGSMN